MENFILQTAKAKLQSKFQWISPSALKLSKAKFQILNTKGVRKEIAPMCNIIILVTQWRELKSDSSCLLKDLPQQIKRKRP